MGKSLLILALVVTPQISEAFTIDPNEFFAYSAEQFHGGQTLFLSREVCTVREVGDDKTLLERFDVAADKPGKLLWNRAMYKTRFGVYEGCWTPVKRGKIGGLVSCVIMDKKLSPDCTLLGKQVFRDTSDLPVAPGAARF
ncbi:hypothetical protein LJR296_008174 [Cupriavidus necator]|uniref:hypothetical protein n=1 Tax=Cupriavidus necator TaxID=106590 RepID=UPI003ECF14BE